MDLKKIKFKTGTAAIYVLALMLVGLGYWNYVSTESNNIQTVAETQTENSEDENLGDAQFVSSNDVTLDTKSTQSTETSTEIAQTESTNNSNDYYEESKLQRDTMYSQTLETYKEMLNNSNVSEEQKAIITQEIANVNKEKNAIMVCENISGVGEITAPIINESKINILRFFFKNWDVIRLKYPIMIMISGSSNIKPKGNTKANTKSIY